MRMLEIRSWFLSDVDARNINSIFIRRGGFRFQRNRVCQNYKLNVLSLNAWRKSNWWFKHRHFFIFDFSDFSFFSAQRFFFFDFFSEVVVMKKAFIFVKRGWMFDIFIDVAARIFIKCNCLNCEFKTCLTNVFLNYNKCGCSKCVSAQDTKFLILSNAVAWNTNLYLDVFTQ